MVVGMVHIKNDGELVIYQNEHEENIVFYLRKSSHFVYHFRTG